MFNKFRWPKKPAEKKTARRPASTSAPAPDPVYTPIYVDTSSSYDSGSSSSCDSGGGSDGGGGGGCD